jgi:hypothetical protein
MSAPLLALLAGVLPEPVTPPPKPLLDQVLGGPQEEPPLLLILPAITLEQVKGAEALDGASVDGFAESLREAAEELFLWRRWRVVDLETTRKLPAELGFGDRCTSGPCVSALVQKTDATHWLSAVILRAKGACRVRATLYNQQERRPIKVLEEDVRPCVAQNILEKGEDLGRRIAEGPRVEPQVSLRLTPLGVPSIDLPDLPDLPDRPTTTATSSYPIERALEVYREQAMRLVIDDQDQSYVVRGRWLLTDCEVLRVASRPIPPEVQSRCDGNLWELGWLLLPVGALGMIPGAANVAEGDSVVPLLLAVSVAVTGPVLALLLDEDALDPLEGEHALTNRELELIVGEANQELRRSLGLSEADLWIAERSKEP